jgi:hypothetical protein
LKKFAAEARPEKTKAVLIWLIDAWSLTVTPPQDKHIAWSRSIQSVLDTRKISHPSLEELIGRLHHFCRIIKFAMHFLCRLRNLLASFHECKCASPHIDADISKDLILWLECMRTAAKGVSPNILVLRIPTHLCRCDAAFHGIGGHSISRGRAWRFETPKELRLRASINLLEFIGSLLGPWVDFVEGNLPPELSIFLQGDNTTAAAWLQKTNFCSKKPAHLKVARRLANLLLKSATQLVNEWTPGDTNEIADSSSRATHLSIAEHSALLHSHFPQQMPAGFAIEPLPVEISSWVGSILRLPPASSEPCPQPTRSKLGCGIAGSPASAPSTVPTTPSLSPWTPLKPNNASSLSSPAASPRPFEQANFRPPVVKAWLQAQSRITSDCWCKPSGQVVGLTPLATRAVDYPRFCQGDMPVSSAKKAISLRVLKLMKQSAITDLDHHTADLAICAFFFACRSCEHLKVQGPRRSKTLRKGDIQFRRGRSILPHNSPDLHLADMVAMLFHDQKNRVKSVWRTAWATSDPDAFPAIAFSNVIRRIDSLPGSNDDTLLHTHAESSNRSVVAVADADMMSALRAAVTAIGEDELGCTAADVGTHSIRSGAAMALVLSGHGAWRIILEAAGNHMLSLHASGNRSNSSARACLSA